MLRTFLIIILLALTTIVYPQKAKPNTVLDNYYNYDFFLNVASFSGILGTKSKYEFNYEIMNAASNYFRMCLYSGNTRSKNNFFLIFGARLPLWTFNRYSALTINANPYLFGNNNRYINFSMDYEKTTFKFITLVASLGYNLYFDASKVEDEKGFVNGPSLSIRVGFGGSTHKGAAYFREMNENELYSIKNYWVEVQQRNNIDDYKKFIHQYPNSEFIPPAHKSIYKILKNNDDKKGTCYFLLDLEEYIEKNLVEQNIEHTKQIVREMFYDKIKDTDSLIANVWYYSIVQNGSLENEVKKWLVEKADDKNTYESDKTYLDALLNTKQRDKSENAIEEELAWEKARIEEELDWVRANQTNTFKAYDEFTTKHPLSKYNLKVKFVITNINETKEAITLYTGRMILISTTNFESEKKIYKPDNGNKFLILGIGISNVHGEFKLSKDDIYIIDSKGNKYNPIYFENYISDKTALIGEPLQIRNESLLACLFSLPNVNDLSLNIHNMKVGQVKLDQGEFLDITVKPIKDKSYSTIFGIDQNEISDTTAKPIVFKSYSTMFSTGALLDYLNK